jgi:hypothetical protein
VQHRVNSNSRLQAHQRQWKDGLIKMGVQIVLSIPEFYSHSTYPVQDTGNHLYEFQLPTAIPFDVCRRSAK